MTTRRLVNHSATLFERKGRFAGREDGQPELTVAKSLFANNDRFAGPRRPTALREDNERFAGRRRTDSPN